VDLGRQMCAEVSTAGTPVLAAAFAVLTVHQCMLQTGAFTAVSH
jgi:hypothetical protein